MIDERFIRLNSNKRSAYIKIGDGKALSNMRDGNWWFRHLAFFRSECGDNMERGDNEDGLISEQYTHPLENCTVKFILHNKEEDMDSKRILCLYRLDLDSKNRYQRVSEKLKDFGDSFVFVDFNNLYDDLKEQGFHIKHGNIRYTNSDYSGSVGDFNKRDTYQHQYEYRIIITSELLLKEIKKDPEINRLSLQRSQAIQKEINPKLPPDERYRADDEVKECEREIEKLKSRYIKKVKTRSGLTTACLPLSILFDNNSISDINI